MTQETPLLLLELHSYLKENHIQFTSNFIDTVTIGDKEYYLAQPRNGKIIDDNFTLISDVVDKSNIFFFGKRWYYTEFTGDLKLNTLKYIGKPDTTFDPIPFLGIHGKYEILNGSRDFKYWCKKAKFLGIDTLGICEKNSLSGTLAFQLECKKQEITPILGATYTIDRDDFKYDLKVYVKNETGWNNILDLNKLCRIDNYNYIPEKEFLKHTEGLVIVFDPKTIDYSKVFILELNISEDIYYQLDTVEYINDDRDKWYLENLRKFIKGSTAPIIITDAYYLDKEDAHIKKKLNTIANKSEYETKNQYFKCLDDYLNELIVLFNPEDNKVDNLIDIAIKNTISLKEKCTFNIPTDKKYLPKYEMNEAEKKQFANNEDLFWGLIEKGLSEKCPESEFEKYLARIDEEVEVIKYGKMIDYFLINYDQVRWCNNNGIMTGTARGSSAGSLVSFLIGITKINPFDYDLIFERFLTKGRVGKEKEDDQLIIETDNGNIELWYDSLVKINRCDNIKLVKAKDLLINDEIIDYL